MLNRSVLILIIAAAGLVSCEKVIDIDLEETDPRLVVEGVISDKQEKYTVRLTRTKDYFDQGPPPAVTNAQVIVKDDAGNTDTLIHSVEGFYQTTGLKQGVVGRTYYLEINLDGKFYSASSQIKPQNPMDSIRPFYLSQPNPFQDTGYYIYMFEKEYPQPDNYYRWIQYRNGQRLEDPIRYLIDNDKFLADKPYIALQFPYRYEYGDTATMEQLSITKEYFDYFTALNAQLDGAGGPFSTPPANPPTNLKGGAIGYFFAVSINSKTIIVK